MIIYKILNTSNGKFYIGSSLYGAKRFSQHKTDLVRNCHDNSYLQYAWNKYGESSFEFSVIEYVSNEKDLLSREQYWMDLTKCYERNIGYNLNRSATSVLGLKHSLEARLKMSIAAKNKSFSKETRNKISVSNKKLDKWPCPEGFNCICNRCREIKNEYSKNYKRKQRYEKKIQASC